MRRFGGGLAQAADGERAFVLAGLLGVACTLGASLASGCGPRTTRPATTAPAKPVATVQEPAPSTSVGVAAAPKPPVTNARAIHLTLYYLAAQPCPDTPQVPLEHCGGGAIATVSHAFHKAVAMQGSAKLCDGRVVGVQKVNPLCFVVVAPEHPWGMTASGRSATPFRSIAVDPKVFPLGRWYYVPELDGLALPAPQEGKVHDGCVHADDVGGAVHGEMVDLFVGAKSAVGVLGATLTSAPLRMASGEGRCSAELSFPSAKAP
jgi:3D (Asp-Asp-Asp) domain-containing protein